MTANKRRYFGKFPGRVVASVDPLGIGRLQVTVPAAPSAVGAWALPCVPYAGPQVGFHFIPPVAANVWVEFEGGDPNYPVWVGCFWSEGERPELAIGPNVKMIQTSTATLMMDDTPDAAEIVSRWNPRASRCHRKGASRSRFHRAMSA